MITEITDVIWLQWVKVFLQVIHFNPWLVQGTLFYFGDVVGNLTDDNLRRVFTVTVWWKWHKPLQWRYNGYDSVSNHQPHDCFLNRLFKRRSKKTSKFRVTGLCAGNSPGTGEFLAQMASNAENVSIWWRHHALAWINADPDRWQYVTCCRWYFGWHTPFRRQLISSHCITWLGRINGSFSSVDIRIYFNYLRHSV